MGRTEGGWKQQGQGKPHSVLAATALKPAAHREHLLNFKLDSQTNL